MLPEGKAEDQKVRSPFACYMMLKGRLYKKSFSLTLCYLQPSEIEYTLHKVHEGICGKHLKQDFGIHGPVVRNYWPNIQEDMIKFEKCYDKC